MKYLETERFLGEAESAEDALASRRLLDVELTRLESERDSLGADLTTEKQLEIDLRRGYLLVDLDRREEAWAIARECLPMAIAAESWQQAVESCDIMFQADQPDSIKALAQGIWLAVTYPIDPELSVAMLQHLVDESPDRSDGAAVAAAAASFVVDMRAEGKQREDLLFFTSQLLGQVARRHSQVDEQEVFEFWVERLELDDPDKFLPRLSGILDLLVDGDWWFDREALREKVPQD